MRLREQLLAEAEKLESYSFARRVVALLRAAGHALDDTVPGIQLPVPKRPPPRTERRYFGQGDQRPTRAPAP